MDLKFGRVDSDRARVPAPPISPKRASAGGPPEFIHFHGRKFPGRLVRAALGVKDLESPDESVRSRAIRDLAMICCQEHGHFNEMYERLINVFRSNAASSAFDDVRKGSFDALYLCHELSLLREIPLDGAKPDLVHHRDWLVAKLEERQERLH